MDATFLTILRELDYDTLTMAQASEVMGALREAVAKGEGWYTKFSAGFVNGTKLLHPPIPDEAFFDAAPELPARRSGRKPKKTTRPRNQIEVAPMVTPMQVGAPAKRGRGRPRKVVPEIVRPTRQVRGGASSDRDNSPSGASSADDHPPIGVLAGSYVSTTGPDPNRAYSLPPTHPRATGAALPLAADPDFTAVEAGKVRFQ